MNHLKVLFILSYFDNQIFDSKDTIIHLNADYFLSDDNDFNCKIVGNKVIDYKKINYDKIFYIGKSSKDNISFGIITPSFNTPENLFNLHLESIIDEKYDYVHVIVDNYSDNLLNIWKRKNIKNSIFISHKSNQVKAIQLGYNLISNNIKYWTWINSDDFLCTDSLKIVENTFNESNTDIVYGKCLFKKGNKDIYYSPDQMLEKNPKLYLLTNVCVSQPSVYYKKRNDFVIEDNLIDDKSINYSFDYNLWIVLAQKNYKFKFTNNFLSIFNSYDDNLSTKFRTKQIEQSLDILKMNYGFVPIKWIKIYTNNLINKKDGIFEKMESHNFKEVIIYNEKYNSKLDESNIFNCFLEKDRYIIESHLGQIKSFLPVKIRVKKKSKKKRNIFKKIFKL